MTVVIDTNAVVSGLVFPTSVPGSVVFLVGRRIESVLSAALVEEIANALLRPKLDRYASVGSRVLVLEDYFARCRYIQVDIEVSVCRDPRDNHVLALALEGKADAIVTGDHDLLVLESFEGIPILAPAEFNAFLDSPADEELTEQ